MHKSILRAVGLCTVLVVVLPGCAEISGNPKTTIGAVGGAAVGGLIAGAAHGSPAAIAASVIGGALVGGLVGNLLDERDRRLASQAAHDALETAPSDRSVAWTNPDTGHSGTVTPQHTYQSADGRYCREYQTTITIDGQPREVHGTACRQPDGTWQVLI